MAFGVAVVRGLWVDNPISTILLRAWCSMILFMILGAIIGYIAKVALDEHFKVRTEQVLEEMNRQGNEQVESQQGPHVS